MKRLIAAMAVFAASLALPLAAHGASATQLAVTTAISISANQVPLCTASTAPINFGNVDGYTQSDASGSISVTCPQGLSYYIGLNEGLHYTPYFRRLSDASSNMFLYHLAKDPAMTNFWGDSDVGGTTPWTSKGPTAANGSNQTHDVYGRTYGGTNAPTGAYTDTVTVWILY